METGSLGLIETWGITPAIEAADAGSKAANVKFIGCETVRAGLITVMFVGDVAAVSVAVNAGAAAAARVGKVVSKHVIPRPDRQVRTAVHTSASFGTARTEKEPTLPAPKTEVKPLSVNPPKEPVPASIQVVEAEDGIVVAAPEDFREEEIEQPSAAEPMVDPADLAAIQPPEQGKKASRKKSKRKALLTRAGG